jgi:endonuclease/exonuclease/phosphatase family metal-dependent hydrolase
MQPYTYTRRMTISRMLASGIPPLALLGLLMTAPGAQAQVTWVPSLNAPVQEAVPTGGGAALLCRGQSGGVTYLGSASGGFCTLNANNSFIQISNYEVAIGLGVWDATQPTNQTAFVGGTQGATSLFACRAMFDNVMTAGYRLGGQAECMLANGGVAKAASSFETFYPFTTSDTYRLLTDSGLCVIGAIFNVPLPPQQTGCGASAGHALQLANVGNNTFNLRAPAVGQCVAADGAGATAMSACGGPAAALKILYANGGASVKVQFVATGHLLEVPLGLNLMNARLVQTSSLALPGQLFQLRTQADFARRMHIASYNIMLLDSVAFPALKQDERAGWIPQALQLTDPGLDVIGVQEVFTVANPLRQQMAANGYNYVSEMPADFNFNEGGALIFSRWPIESTESIVFDECDGHDCSASKGVTYALINKLGRKYHVFNTHLQADAENFATRRSQLRQMRTFINSRVGVATNDPVLLLGDFNVDMESQPADYAEMLQILGGTFYNAPRQPGAGSAANRWTVNPATNQITAMRGGDASWLDYVLTATPGPNPLGASYVVREYERSSYWIDIGILGFGKSGYVRDLSDHSALLGTLRFAYAPPQAAGATFPVTFQVSGDRGTPVGAGVVVNGQRYPMPVTLDLAGNQTHTISADESVPSAAGERWFFERWSDAGPVRTFTLSGLDKAKTYESMYTQQFFLTANASPNLAGTVSGGGWHFRGTGAQVTAAATAGFTFTGFTGAVNSTQPTVTVPMSAAKTVTANFVSNGTPLLHVLTGSRTDVAVDQRLVELFLRNAGTFPATNARITGIGPVVVTLGSGVVTPAQSFPVSIGTVLPGTQVPGALTMQWPSTARRVSFTVFFAADGGYTGQTTLNLIR